VRLSLLLLLLLPQERTDAAGIRLVLVPAGEFAMGSAGNDQAIRSIFMRSGSPNAGEDLQSERPQHRVRISKAFQMGATEVTVAQFRRFVEATKHVTDAEKDNRGARGFNRAKGDFESDAKYTWKDPGFPQGDDHPVVNVSWNDAAAFCEWLGRQEKATYRLPTEAEWEYACRGGTDTWLNFGDAPAQAHLHANLADVSLEKAHKGMVARQLLVNVSKDPEDGFAYTAPVGRFKPNAFGLFDLHGNVWEWCQDRYQRFYYQQFEPRKVRTATADPVGPEKSDEHGDWRVLRGGSWAVEPFSARSSSRLWNDHADGFCYAGFRVVRVGP
jgi:formylglycine-generating enzyme